MWELTLQIIKAGFPLLWVILSAMIISTIWNRKEDSKSHKIKWTAVVVVPILLAVIVWISMRNQTQLPPIAGTIAGFFVLLAPFVGIGTWLFIAYR